ncbi:glutathione-regulated potassium-efflux system ATP-binding protein [Vibrio astriarenae]|nr:glutathione-regulated potassium-efflux system ATP-binding protein [Vibrio sp. C7]
MAEYVYTMSRVSKIVPPKRQILKDISLSFFLVQKSVFLVLMVRVNRLFYASCWHRY